jgi:hypothetical protein
VIEKIVAQSITEQTRGEQWLQDQKLFKKTVESDIDSAITGAAKLGKDTAYCRLSACVYPTANSISNLKNMVVETYRRAGYEVSAHSCNGITEVTISW